jgi:GNAT superfamily N-acetyltransferase
VVAMPTGDEPPKGFEKLYEDRKAVPEIGTITIDSVAASQLAAIEVKEIEHLRLRARAFYLDHLGIQAMPFSLEDMLLFAPQGRSISDKLIFRSYSHKFLAAYSHVLTCWPKSDEWTFMALILDPSFRDQGIGAGMLSEIEKEARDAGVVAVCIAWVDSYETEGNFGETAGYTTEIDRFNWTMGTISREIILYRKEL